MLKSFGISWLIVILLLVFIIFMGMGDSDDSDNTEGFGWLSKKIRWRVCYII